MFFKVAFSTDYKIEENLIFKKPLPNAGIICSNPRRAERIAQEYLENVILLKEYQSAWPLDIYVGTYQNKALFVAGIPVGAAGAAFAIQQLRAAGAEYIIRYGSNDDPHITPERMQEVIIVDRADNLFGLMQGSGAPEKTWGMKIKASSTLVTALRDKASALAIPTQLAICHHVEDYGAYAFPESAGNYARTIQRTLKALHSNDHQRLHTRDMESAALFYRAELDKFHAVTVLQNIPKFRGMHQTYDGKQGETAQKIEATFCKLIFSTLAQFAKVPELHTSIKSKL